MKVVLRNPHRVVDMEGPLRVNALIERLALNRESVLVVRGDTLVPGDGVLEDADTVEIRPVISGGAWQVPPVPGPGDHRDPTPQREILQSLLHAPLP